MGFERCACSEAHAFQPQSTDGRPSLPQYRLCIHVHDLCAQQPFELLSLSLRGDERDCSTHHCPERDEGGRLVYDDCVQWPPLLPHECMPPRAEPLHPPPSTWLMTKVCKGPPSSRLHAVGEQAPYTLTPDTPPPG